MRKLFTFLCAALMSAGMFATTVVTITEADFPMSGTSFTKDGVTVSAVEIDGISVYIYGEGSFSTTLGNFTKIEVSAEMVGISGEGWSGNLQKMTWTGNASSVPFSGDIYYAPVTLKFTIGEDTPAAVENVQTNQVQGTKILRDGMLLIERNGVLYDITGTEVR